MPIGPPVDPPIGQRKFPTGVRPIGYGEKGLFPRPFVSPLTPHAVGVERTSHGRDGFQPNRTRRNSGNGCPGGEARGRFTLFGVLGVGPTGAWSRSQWFQSEVTEGLGLKHWDVSEN